MTYRTVESDKEIILETAGSIRVQSSAQFRQALMELIQNAQGRAVVADLSQVEYVDSSGLAVLVEAWRAARKAGIRLVLRGVRQNLKYLLEVTRLLPMFELEEAAPS